MLTFPSRPVTHAARVYYLTGKCSVFVQQAGAPFEAGSRGKPTDRIGTIYISFDKPLPSTPSPNFGAGDHANQLDMLQTLQQAFAKRPIWTRQTLQLHVAQKLSVEVSAVWHLTLKFASVRSILFLHQMDRIIKDCSE